MLKHKLKQKRGLAIIAILYNLFVFRKQIYAILHGNLSPIFEFKQDATLFVSQIMLGINNLPFRTNPFWGGVSENSQVGRNYPIYLLGKISGTIGLDLSFTFLFGVLVVSSLFIWSLHKIQYIFIGRIKFGFLLTLTVSILVFGDLAQRPSPTQWALPLVIFSIVLMIKFKETTHLWEFLGIGIAISGLLVIFNPFYSIFVLIFILVSSLGKFERRLHWFIFILLLIVTAFVLGTLMQNIIQRNSDFQLINRWGLLFSHFPGSFKNTSILFALILVNLALYKKKTDNSLEQTVVLICASTIITMQQNVITGIWWEPESHYAYIVNLCVFLTLLNLMREFRENRDENLNGDIKRIVLVVFVSILLFGKIETHDALNFSSYRVNLAQNLFLREIQEVLERETNTRDLIATPVNLSNEITWAGLLSNRRFVWDYQGSLLSGSDSEVLTRYMCNMRSNFSSENEIPNLYLTQGHRFLNAKHHFIRWMHLTRWLPSLNENSVSTLTSSESNRVKLLLPFVFEKRCLGMKEVEATKILTIEQGNPVIKPVT